MQTHPIDAHVGQQVRTARHIAGLTQADLGKLLNVKFQQVQKYETGANRISASKLALTAQATKQTIGWFFDSCDACGPTRANCPSSAQSTAEAKALDMFRALSDAQQAAALNVLKAMNTAQVAA